MKQLYNIKVQQHHTLMLTLLLTLLVAIPSLHARQTGPAGTPQNGLVAYYPFDGGNANLAATEEVTNAVANRAVFATNTIAFNGAGLIGNCLVINGANQTDALATAVNPATFPGAADNAVDGTNEYSVSFWFQPSANLAAGTTSLLSKRTDCFNTSVFWDLRINTDQVNNPDRIAFGHEVYINGATVSNNVGGVATDANCGNWRHVVITRTVNPDDNMAVSRLYIDGVLLAAGQAAVVQNIVDNAVLGISGSGCINGFNPDGTIEYSGLFDEMMVYNRALNDTEISDLHIAFRYGQINCCRASHNEEYLQMRAGMMTQDELDALQDYGIRRWNPTSNVYVIGDGNTHIMPNKVFIGDDVILEVRNGSTADFTNADVVFGECGNIAANAGNIVAHNAIFRPCDEFGSWRGIEIGNRTTGNPNIAAFPGQNASLTFNECTFVNAVEAVYTTTRETNAVIELNLSNNTFTNCETAFRVHRTTSARSLTFRGAITGNTIHIDDQVTDINYCEGQPTEFAGIVTEATHLRLLLISDNEFIDATRLRDNVPFEGIRMTTTVRSDINGNRFVNNDRAIVLMKTNSLSIENNIFEVTRRSTSGEDTYQITYEGPDGGGGSQSTLIRANRFINSAEITTSSVNLADPTPGSGAIYANGKANYLTIEDNEIDGFEIGIFADANLRHLVGLIRNNRISTYNYGIYQRNITPKALGIYTMHIACNQIDMKRAPVGSNMPVEGIRIMGIPAPTSNGGVGVLSSNILIEGNCISNTNVGVNIIAGYDTGYGGYADMPHFRHNYLYNYRETGLRVENIKGGNMTNNSYIGNNQADDILQVITAGSGATLFSDRDHFGNGVAEVNGNVNATLPATPMPSGASCGNQDLGNMANDPLIRCYNDIGLYKISGAGVVESLSFGDLRLTEKYSSEFEVLYKTDEAGAFEVAVTGVQMLSSEEEAGLLYALAIERYWEKSDMAYLEYQYALRMGDMAGMSEAVEKISPIDADEKDQKMLYRIQLNRSANNGELTEADQKQLLAIIKKEGPLAPVARNIMHQSKGGFPSQYPAVDVSVNEGINTVAEEYLGEDILLMPNPADDLISVRIGDSVSGRWQTATIYSLTGSTMEVKQISANQLQFNVGHLKRGMYLVTLKDINGNQVTKRFVKR